MAKSRYITRRKSDDDPTLTHIAFQGVIIATRPNAPYLHIPSKKAKAKQNKSKAKKVK